MVVVVVVIVGATSSSRKKNRSSRGRTRTKWRGLRLIGFKDSGLAAQGHAAPSLHHFSAAKSHAAY